MENIYRPLEHPEPLRLQVHGTLERLVVDGHLKPGQRLVETELAERLGVSRGPIREALQMLAREGWVELRPRQGAYVAKPTPQELVDYFDVRALLETEAARLAARAVHDGVDDAGREVLAELEDVVVRSTEFAHRIRAESPDWDEDVHEEARKFHREGSQRFHGAMVKLTGNAALVDLLTHLSKRTRWYFSPGVLDRTVAAWEAHEAIRTAITKGDEDAAASIMAAHMQATRDAYLDAHERRSW